MTINFTVYGEPTAQGRPKFARRGKFVTAYDPKKSREYKDTVYSVALEHKPKELLEGALVMQVDIYRSIPKSFSKVKRTAIKDGILRPTTKPDCSNVVKGIEDALNGVIYKDDSQIVESVVKKFYSDTPRVAITIFEI